MILGFAFAAESIQPHFEEAQGGAEITYVLPRCPKVPLRVQFTGRVYLSMTLISTHQPTFSTAGPSKVFSLTMGRACADTLKQRTAQSTSYPHFSEFMGVRHVKKRNEA